jgi:hypothetical protein
MKTSFLRTLITIASLVFVGVIAGRANAELVGWWTFDDTAEDQSGNGNHGELVSGSYDANVPPQIGSGKSLNLQEDVDHVYVEGDASLDSEIFTLSMFVYDNGQQDACDEDGTTCAMERLTSREGDQFETALNWHPPFNGMGGLSFYSPASGWQRSEHIPPTAGWQHVAYVADGELMTTYADGEVVDERPFTAAPTGFMHLGNRWNDTEGFDGLLDDVALWDEALPAATIAALASGAQRPGGQVAVPGDFDANGQLDAADINALTNAIVTSSTDTRFDLDKNATLNLADHTYWVETLKKTYFGDANLDGEFNSADFVIVFQAGQYEDTAAGNSKWETGDWNGDTEFNSSDFVTAFQAGGYEKGPRPAAAVPEPTGCLWLVALAVQFGIRRLRR